VVLVEQALRANLEQVAFRLASAGDLNAMSAPVVRTFAHQFSILKAVRRGMTLTVIGYIVFDVWGALGVPEIAWSLLAAQESTLFLFVVLLLFKFRLSPDYRYCFTDDTQVQLLAMDFHDMMATHHTVPIPMDGTPSVVVQNPDTLDAHGACGGWSHCCAA
jgi:hypothetical protein